MRFIVLLLVAMVSSVHADAGQKPLPEDVKLLEACLKKTSENQPYPSPGSRCVWEIYQNCVKTTGDSQVDNNKCYMREHAAWDKSLNEAYKAKIASFKENLKFAEGEFEKKSFTEAADLLQKAQRAWIQYRDMACSSVSASYSTGNGGANASWACTTRITAQRTIQLIDE